MSEPTSAGAVNYELLPFDFQQVQRSIVPVISWDGATLTGRGTAFAVHGDGIFVTARHVVDDWVDAFAERTHAGTAGLYILIESDIALASTAAEPDVEAALGGLLPVLGVNQDPHSDLALLHTMQAYHCDEAVPFPALPLSSRLPSLGQR